MKRYNKNGRLGTITCNRYGKKLVVQQGIVREGCISVDHAWDYPSERDGQIHHSDLCEECHDELVSGFKIPVDREEQVEFPQDGIRRAAKTVLLSTYPRIPCGGYGEIFGKAVSVQYRNLSLDEGRQIIRHFPGNVVV